MSETIPDQASETEVSRPREPRWQVLALAGMLVAALLCMRVAIPDPDSPVFLMAVLPIAMIALEYGKWGGIWISAFTAIVLVVWVQLTGVDLDWVDYVARFCLFGVVGVGLGYYSSKVRSQQEQLADLREESEARNEILRALTDASPDVIFSKDSGGHYTLLNRAGVEAFGLESEADALGKRDRDFLPEVVADRFSQLAVGVRSSKDGEPINEEVRIDKDLVGADTDLVYEATVGWLHNQRDPKAMFAVARNVTEARRAEIELRRAARHFEISLDMMCTTDYDGNFIELNDRWEEVLGWTKEELMEMSLEDRVHPDDLEASRAALAEAREEVVNYTNRFRTKTGEWKWLQWTRAAEPDVEKIYAVARDVTAEQEVDQLKNEFFALVSHELRTPLTSIIGYLELLGDDQELTPSQREYVEILGRSSRRMVRLVGDLLYAARIEAGREVYVDRQPIDLAEVVRHSVETAQPAARAAGVNLEGVSLPETLQVSADKGRMGQAIDNLISNAIKFTPKGGEIEVSVEDSAEQARISVKDTGSGISAEDQKSLFERFFRTDSARDQAIPGVGLGLPIVRSIAIQHDGDVEVTSRPGVGSMFTLVISKEAQNQEAAL